MHRVKSVAVITLALVVVAIQAKNKPAIKITDVPKYDAKGGTDRVATIKGTAEGLGNCKDCRVVIFAHTNKWWVQPLANDPYTPIVDGKWQGETHLGTDYAALLVTPAYKAPPTAERLPTIGPDVLAVDTKPGKL
jgi:hypothetical protein